MKTLYKTFLFALAVLSMPVAAVTKVTFATGVSGNIKEQYEYNVVKLALDYSKDRYGDYELSIRPGDDVPSYTRLRIEAENNDYTNMVYKDSVSNDLVERLKPVPFPVELGVSSYRVGLTSVEKKAKLQNIASRSQASELKIIQGRGWLDGDILRSQGFTVVEGRYIEGLFYMAANGRGDLFPLGAHELKRELDKFSYIDGLTYDTEICIYYPLPKFLFTNKNNTALADRLEYGLKAAFESGSLTHLWKKFFYERLQFADLKNRKIFRFQNPHLSKIDPSYEAYIIDPNIL
ncbi:hypothetical protein [Gayadomonas joobiniege]|uniref:hypothetical protein n=1 Tax=Gayadomonas joobiniege TaxID=1234606 RepID=UPI0003653977|nr:hypothetical protein [Gayadomonas joobiniege]